MERSQRESSPPSICIAFGGQKVKSNGWNFLVRASRLSRSLPDNPFLSVSSCCRHWHTHTVTHTQKTVCHPAQRLGALAKFRNQSLGSGLPENNGMDLSADLPVDLIKAHVLSHSFPDLLFKTSCPPPPILVPFVNGMHGSAKGAVSLIKLFALGHPPLFIPCFFCSTSTQAISAFSMSYGIIAQFD